MPPAPPFVEFRRLDVLGKLKGLDTPENQVYQDTAALAAQLFGAEVGLIGLFEKELLRIKASAGLEQQESPLDLACYAQTIQSSATFVVEDTRCDPRFAQKSLALGRRRVRFYAGTPLFADGLAVGILAVMSSRPRKPSSDRLRALEALARQVSAVLELRLNAEESATHKRELRLALDEADEMAALLKHSAQRFENLFGGLPVACMTLNTEAKVMEWNAMSETVYGFTASEVLFKNILNLVVPVAHRAKAKRRFAKHIRDGGHNESHEWQVLRKDKTPIWVLSRSLPLYGPAGELVGLISTNIDITDRKNAEASLIESKALIEKQKAELELANTRLERLASTDGLTGLHNHRTFQNFLRSTFATAQRHQYPLSVVILDVDNFKSYNDTFGHPQGDVVLRAVAQILRDCAREGDMVARYGGEEFAIVLPATDSTGALVTAERMRKAIEEAHWPNRRLTASFGIASIVPVTVDPADLIRSADEALYASKESGRNRVTVSSSPVKQAA